MENFEVLVDLAELKKKSISYMEDFYNDHKNDKDAVPMACGFLLVKHPKKELNELVIMPPGDLFQNSSGKDIYANMLRYTVRKFEDDGFDVIYYLFSSEIWLAKSNDPNDPRNQPGPNYVPPSDRPDSTDAVLIVIESKTFAEVNIYDIDKSTDKIKLVLKEETTKRLEPGEMQGRFAGILCK